MPANLEDCKNTCACRYIDVFFQAICKTVIHRNIITTRPCLLHLEVIIRLEESAYTVDEGEAVEVCAIITIGTDSTVTASLLGVDGSAIGKESRQDAL